MKILIVDDEKHIRDLLRDYLENEGYVTALCENGLVAVDYMINNNDIDLIFNGCKNA
jgi:DNA-binding response OmpR family regulator